MCPGTAVKCGGAIKGPIHKSKQHKTKRIGSHFWPLLGLRCGLAFAPVVAGAAALAVGAGSQASAVGLVGSVAVAPRLEHGLSSRCCTGLAAPAARGIFRDQGSHPGLLRGSRINTTGPPRGPQLLKAQVADKKTGRRKQKLE